MPYLIHYAVAAGSLPNAKYRADIFGAQFAVPNAYDSYEKLALDENVDIVYVGATNQLHYPIVMMMLHAGKHVLVEKVCGAASALFALMQFFAPQPTAMNEQDAKDMFDLAKAKV